MTNMFSNIKVSDEDIKRCLTAEKKVNSEIIKALKADNFTEDNVFSILKRKVGLYTEHKKEIAFLKKEGNWCFVYGDSVLKASSPTIKSADEIFALLLEAIDEKMLLSRTEIKSLNLDDSFIEKYVSDAKIKRLKVSQGYDNAYLEVQCLSLDLRMKLYGYFNSVGSTENDQLFLERNVNSLVKSYTSELLLAVIQALLTENYLINDEERKIYEMAKKAAELSKKESFDNFKEKLEWDQATAIEKPGGQYFQVLYGSVHRFICLMCEQNENFRKKYMEGDKNITNCVKQLEKELQEGKVKALSDLEVYKKALLYFIPEAVVTATIQVDFPGNKEDISLSAEQGCSELPKSVEIFTRETFDGENNNTKDEKDNSEGEATSPIKEKAKISSGGIILNLSDFYNQKLSSNVVENKIRFEEEVINTSDDEDIGEGTQEHTVEREDVKETEKAQISLFDLM